MDLISARYDESMKGKIAVSIPEPLLRRVRSEVRSGRTPSVSAYVSEALAEKTRRDELVALLDELDADLGPPSERQMRWARRVLGLSS